MIDREKVIKGLNSCAKWMKENDGDACNSCPYHNHFSYDDNDCIAMVNSEAIVLLKEQEAITIKKTKEHGFGVYGGICPKCRNWIQSAHSYCGFCGQAVKWE